MQKTFETTSNELLISFEIILVSISYMFQITKIPFDMLYVNC